MFLKSLWDCKATIFDISLQAYTDNVDIDVDLDVYRSKYIIMKIHVSSVAHWLFMNTSFI